MSGIKVFDAHFHIIDRRYPLVPNDGYLPEEFSCDDYLSGTGSFDLAGGALVSGSFQAFDQRYLLAALERLGPRFVGVTQLPVTVSDEQILRLDAAGVRAVCFNLRRGGSEGLEHLEKMAWRVYELAGWHIEIYIDSRDLPEIHSRIVDLPALSIDHLGISKAGFDAVLRLVERGSHLKATGFGRVDLDVRAAIKALCSVNPDALMFGTDLPSTRAPRPYRDEDRLLILQILDDTLARKVLYANAVAFYRPRQA